MDYVQSVSGYLAGYLGPLARQGVRRGVIEVRIKTETKAGKSDTVAAIARDRGVSNT